MLCPVLPKPSPCSTHTHTHYIDYACVGTRFLEYTCGDASTFIHLLFEFFCRDEVKTRSSSIPHLYCKVVHRRHQVFRNFFSHACAVRALNEKKRTLLCAKKRQSVQSLDGIRHGYFETYWISRCLSPFIIIVEQTGRKYLSSIIRNYICSCCAGI